MAIDPLPPVQLPHHYAASAGAAAAPARFWTAFGDPALDRLVERAFAHNLQLRATWARLQQGRALARAAGAPLWPELTLSASVAAQKNRFDLGQPVGEITPTTRTFTASLGASYEVDLWRRIDSTGRAAALDALALRDDAEAMAISLAAELTEAWLDLRAQRARRELLTAQLQINQASQELLELRLREGLATALDVYQQRSLVAASRAQLVQTESALVTLSRRLAVLVGATAIDVTAAPRSLPALPPLPAAGVPASLLAQRPDVRAARRRVEAADHRVAAAVAERLPGLRLQGAVSLQDSSPLELLAAPLWSLLAAVTAPLFDGGRRSAEVERQRAVVAERLASFGQVLLVAMAEVETALGQERSQEELLRQLAAQVELAGATVREARDRYREGQIEYLPVLSALQAEQQSQLALLQAQRQQLSLRVQLYRALGGSHLRTLQEPELARPAAAR